MIYFFRITGMILFLIFSTQLFAQKRSETFSLSGTVTDTSGHPLAGASIYISDLRKGAVADGSGDFLIKNIPGGNFLVNVDMTGYRSELQNIHFNKDIQMDFSLEIAVTEEKEIVITGSLKATSLKRNPIPIVSISRTFLKQNLSTNIVNAIASVPGVNAVTTGPNVAKPFIRGLGFNRILTLFDGVRQEGQQWGEEHGIEIDENLVDRVEVVKGPASLLYGSDAIGGVVNFIPPSAPPEGVKRGSASLDYQTNNNLVEGSANMESHVGDFSWGVIGSHKMAADYQNKIDGRVYNTGFRESSLFFQSALSKSWGYSRIGLSYYNNLQEIPDGLRDSATRKFERPISDDEFEIVPQKELRSYKISDVYQRIQHFRVYNISNFTVGKGRLGTQLGFQKNIRQEFDDPESNEAGLHLDLNTVTYDVKYFFPQINKVSVTAGTNGMYQVNKSDKGNEFLIPNYKQFDFGPFLYAKISNKKAEWVGGIRYDIRHFRNDGMFVDEHNGKDVPVYGPDTVNATKLFSDYDHTFGGFSGSLGFSYRFNSQWNFKLNVARGFRAPNISEISSNGIHTGSKIYQLGNKEFKPEFSFQQDIGITYDALHVTINASAFNNNIQNYIFNQKLVNGLGEDSVIVPGFETFQYSASRAHLFGGEFSVDIHPHPLDWLHFENSVSIVFARNTGYENQHISADEMYLPFIPPIHGRSELRANFNEWHKMENLYFKIQLDLYARQNRVFSLNETETPTPGYQLFNVGMGTDITNKKGRTVLTVNLMTNNLFNTAYQSHMSRLKYFEDYPTDARGHYGIYNMGRNVSLKVSVPFDF